MRYWWVNHKQTFRHEFEGGYLWSPKRSRVGRGFAVLARSDVRIC